MAEDAAPPSGKNLCALDGGGIRGAIQLIILDNIMVTIQNVFELPELPLPCHYFDLIGGTSTGGLNALLLGRLRMSTQEATEIYPGFAQAVFGTPKSRMRLPFSGGNYTAYSATTMEKEIKAIVLSKVKDIEGNRGGDEPMLDKSPDSCRTFVLTVPSQRADDKSGPRLITSYPPRIGRHFPATIWEGARATSAAPGFLKEITIGPAGFAETFIDGGLGGNNPIKQVISEASTVFGPNESISCIISIGTGILKHAKYDRSFIPTSLVGTLVKISTECEKTQQEVATDFQEVEDVYFRFNVEQGLQDIGMDDWSRLGEVKTHTEAYLRAPEIQKKLEKVARLLHNRPTQLPFSELRIRSSKDAKPHDEPTFSLALRPPPAHFYGRTEYVDRIVGTIAAAKSSGRGAHLCIRGYGGIGKTSVALTVCHHPAIASIFGQRRFFVNCENTATASLLLQAIAAELRIDVSKGDALTLVESGVAMMSGTEPVLLVLDNAETFLYSAQDTTGTVEDFLSRIASINLFTLMLTKRGLEQPFHVKWDSLEELGVLGLEAARDTFLSITQSEEHASSPGLNEILVELDCVPLAVSLCAQVVQSGGETLEEFARRWKTKKTDLLKLQKVGGDSKDTSVQVSIEISLQSSLLSDSGDYARRLLRIVAHFPDGIYSPHIERLSEHWQSDVSNAEHALKRLSLAHRRPNSKFLTTLSPIRQYVSKHYPTLDDDLKSMVQWHLELCSKGRSEPGDPDFLSALGELTANRGNVHMVLRQALEKRDASQDILAAVSQFSTFLYWNSPDSELLELALITAPACEPKQKGQLLYGFGSMLCEQSKHDRAGAILKEAHEVFQATGDRIGAARCLLRLGNNLRMQSKNDDAKATLEEARDEFRAVGDRVGAAQCLIRLGDILRLRGKYSSSRATLEEARGEFQAIGNRLGAARCLKLLGDILHMQTKNDEARAALEEAQCEFKVIGNRLGSAQCLSSLGSILRMQSRYDDSIAAAQEAREEFQAIRNSIGAAVCLKSIGVSLRIQGKHDGARVALEEAHAEFQAMGDRFDAADTLLELGELSRVQGYFLDARANMEAAKMQFQAIGSLDNVAWCLLGLGKIMIAESKYDGAKAVLREAMGVFKAIGAPEGINACQEALAQIVALTTESVDSSNDSDGAPAVQD